MISFSSLFNMVPVVGHIKSVIHYAMGDAYGGKFTLAEATRSWVVLSVTATYEGPGGPVVGALGAGLLMDIHLSALMGKPHGIIKAINLIFEEISECKLPVKSLIAAGLTISTDIAYGHAVNIRNFNLNLHQKQSFFFTTRIEEKSSTWAWVWYFMRSQFVKPDSEPAEDEELHIYEDFRRVHYPFDYYDDPYN